jgi:hypothetical protein
MGLMFVGGFLIVYTLGWVVLLICLLWYIIGYTCPFFDKKEN